MSAYSIRERLRNRADELGLEFQQAIQFYAIERFLYRLSTTQWAERLIVKGATMLRVWGGAVARPTRDIDFLGRIENTSAALETILRQCIDATVPDDGLDFERVSIEGQIVLEARYPGIRAKVVGSFAGARFVIRIDVGVNDATVPAPDWVEYPILLDGPVPRILAYRPETSIAEKLEAIVSLGLVNSRMKDFFDVWTLLKNTPMSESSLASAIKATFDRRGTEIPAWPPVALTSEFTNQSASQQLWKSYSTRLRQSGIEAPDSLEFIVSEIKEKLEPVIRRINAPG